MLLTRKNEALTELTAAAMLISFTLILVLVNTTSMVADEMSADLRAQQIFMLILIYFIISLFVSASWLWGFVARSLFTLPTVTILMLNQSAHDDEIRFGQEWASAALIFLFIETSTYINMKAKAELFVRIAHSEQQQRQLADLLDMVPDCVLICQPSEPVAAKSSPCQKAVYANRKTSSIFGRQMGASKH